VTDWQTLQEVSVADSIKRIDSFISLAVTMQANRGAFALLVASGISRAASIPTGWEVVLDLVRKVANLQKADCEPDPAAWYRAEYDEDPDYSKLLNTLAKSEAERQQLLHPLFEPDEQEREQGRKQPTQAHRAIARLVANGYVRVIVTPNFDRLLELALQEVGVTPQVISTPDAVKGALPWMLAPCTIVKVHGDYVDTRLKNTVGELESYHPRINDLLERIFDEFGLIVCGWSADWDTALRDALTRCSNHRFTTYWGTRGEPSDLAQGVIRHRRAEVIPITDADGFFEDLMEKVQALEEIKQPHPMSAPVSVARLKRYLPNEQERIRLHDLMDDATTRVLAAMNDDEAFPVDVEFDQEEFVRRVRQYEALTEVVRDLIITGCYWGEPQHQGAWVRCLERSANVETHDQGIWRNLRRYPALLLLYAGGMAAIAGGKYDTLGALLTRPRRRRLGEVRSLWAVLNPVSLLDDEIAKHLPGQAHSYVPLNNHLYNVLKEPLAKSVLDGDEYEDLFNRFEYLLAMVVADQRVLSWSGPWAPIGKFGCRDQAIHRGDRYVPKVVSAELETDGESWLLLQAGLFGGSLERAQEAKKIVDDLVSRLGWH
jgi:hypothetical protein